MTPSPVPNHTPPWIVPHPRELPESDADLVYNLQVIKTPVAAIPARELAEKLDAVIGKAPVKELHALVLRYVTVSDDYSPRLAVFHQRWDDLGGAVKPQWCLTLMGYADWMPKTVRAIKYPRRHGFTFRCEHAYRDHVWHGTSDFRCHVNEKGDHWVKNCPGQVEHEIHTSTRSAAYAAKPDLSNYGELF